MIPEFVQTTIGEKVFRVDDIDDEAPMMQMEFFNEFAELPYAVRRDAARAGLGEALRVLKFGALGVASPTEEK